MSMKERQERRAAKAVGKTTRVRLYKRKNLEEASIYVTGEITKAVYLGQNEEGRHTFKLTLVAGVDCVEHEAVVDSLPR